MCLLIGLYEHFIAGQTTGIRVLDDSYRWSRETADSGQRSIEIKDVVVGEFFPVQHLCACNGGIPGGRGVASPTIKSRVLVWIFTVAQGLAKLHGQREFLWKIFTCAQVFSNGSVITGGMLEGNS